MKNYLDSIDRAALRSRAEQMLHTAGDACDQAGRFMNTTTEKIRGFSLIEFFIYETCLLSFGLWLGTCFSKFFKKFRAIIFAAFAATWLYLRGACSLMRMRTERIQSSFSSFDS